MQILRDLLIELEAVCKKDSRLPLDKIYDPFLIGVDRDFAAGHLPYGIRGNQSKLLCKLDRGEQPLIGFGSLLVIFLITDPTVDASALTWGRIHRQIDEMNQVIRVPLLLLVVKTLSATGGEYPLPLPPVNRGGGDGCELFALRNDKIPPCEKIFQCFFRCFRK